MDGLTISTANKFVESGKTFSELGKEKIRAGGSQEGSQSFVDTLSDAVNKVNTMQQEADHKIQQLASGENTNISEVMIATEKADIALKLMMSVRNKVIDAYQEIMKMQV